MKDNLLVIASTFPRWKGDSTPPFVYELSKRLTDEFNVYVVAPYSYGSKKEENLSEIQVHRFKYWFDKKNNVADGAILPNLKKNKLFWFQIPFLLISEFFKIIKVIIKEDIDLIHAHWTIPHGFIAYVMKILFGINYVTTSHGGDIFGLEKLNFLKKIVVQNSIKTTVVSNAIKNKFLEIGVDEDNIEVIPMGTDLTRFSPEKKDKLLEEKYGSYILFVGRLSEKKGINYLIKAMPEILKEFPEIKLLIIGDGEEKDNLVKLTESLNLEGNVIFTGAIPNENLPKYYATADIFIGPSVISKGGDREGFGLVFVESLASGCITVSSDLDAIKDIIIEGKTGYMVKQKNHNDIFEKVKYILNNKKEAQKTAKKGREYVLKKYGWKNITKKYKKVLKNE